ncbi:MAG TPA: hypothetical protein VLF68_04840 [Candidatus Saccharimonadales bacterium]|nr:hypothetical protein [Candidatus Saccharimonadales bacterium]
MRKAISAQDKILDISVNLARVGNWTADSYETKRKLIQFFIEQTNGYIKELDRYELSPDAQEVIDVFQNEYQRLLKEKVTDQNKDIWAEKMLTWANILTHRAKLA